MKIFIFGLSLRLLLASLHRLPLSLSTRVEISSPINSLRRTREGLFLEGLGRSPYEGWAFHSPPLILPFLRSTLSHEFFCIIPFLLADCLTYFLLQRLQTSIPNKHNYIADFYWLNPWCILIATGCSLSTFENLFLILAIHAAFEQRPSLCGLSLSIASYLGLHPTLLLIPMMMLVCKQSTLKHGLIFIGSFIATSLCLIILSAAYLAQYEDHSPLHLFPSLSDLKSLDHIVSFEDASKAHHWILETYWFQLRVEDLTPNMGLYWYFFTEMFPFYRSFFLFVFHSLSFTFLIPLCLRFPKQPLLIILLQSITISMLKPYPTLGDYSLVFLLVLMELPSILEWCWFLFISISLLFVLEPVMWHEWVDSESANSNFYYSINLLIGSFHIILMIIILDSNVRRRLKSKHD